MAPRVAGLAFATAVALASLAAASPSRLAGSDGAAAHGAASVDQLKRDLQAMLDNVSAKYQGLPMQLAWKSASVEFALASGQVRLPGSPTARPTTTKDTFLFGSGAKPFTATAVMALRDRGALSLDDALESHVDPVLAKLKPGASLRALFGDAAGRITIGHTLRMQSGLQDFDVKEFNDYLLRANETDTFHSPYEFVEYSSRQQPPLLCEPGTCVHYTSNNFVLLGFVLLAHSNATNWWELDLPALLPSDEARASLGSMRFLHGQRLNEVLTVPGSFGGGATKVPHLTIWNQSSTILGWTCGNAVGSASDMASFIWALLGPEPRVLPEETVQEMLQFRLLDTGWGAGYFQYGAGVMIESVAFTPGLPPLLPNWGSYMGHGGDTFGFLSEQGIVSNLGAAVSIVAAQETSDVVKGEAFCQMVMVAARALYGLELRLPCFPFLSDRSVLARHPAEVSAAPSSDSAAAHAAAAVFV